MLHTNASAINFSEYNRFFTLGCSFTNWHWPTWANLLHKEYPHLKLYNYAKPALGNSYIAVMLDQLDKHYELQRTDLVAICWSTFGRNSVYQTSDIKRMIRNHEQDYFDHTSPDNWNSLGDTYASMEHHKNLDCDRGRLIKDLSTISLVSNMLTHANFSAFQFYSIGPEQQSEYDIGIYSTKKDDIFDMYAGLHTKMIHHSMHSEFGLVTDPANPNYVYNSNWGEENHADTHPTATQYAHYLNSAGFMLSSKTFNYAEKCHKTMKHTKNLQDLNWQYCAWPTHHYPL